jgi:hypothetical protein
MNSNPLKVVALGLILACTAYGQKSGNFSSEALHGLSTLGVLVEFDGNPQVGAGLSAGQLRSEIILRLNLAGLKVLAGQGQEKEPYLYLSVHSIPVIDREGATDSFYYATSLDLTDYVHPARLPSKFARACTWSEGYSIMVPASDLREVTEKVGDLALDFVKAVEAANQVKEPEVKAVF